MIRHAVILALAVPFALTAQSGPGKTLDHPSGIVLEYPASWQTRQEGGLVAMVPDGFAADEKGQPLELFLLGSESAAGIATPGDPKVIAYLEEQLGQLLGPVKRAGEVTTLTTTLGAGAVIPFEASPKPGAGPVAARVYVVLHEGTGIFLAHIARKDLMAKREAAAKAIFASFRARKRDVDAALLHTWRRENYTRSSGNGASLSNSTYVYWTFQADGTVLYSTRSHTYGDTAGLGVIVQGDSTSDVSKGKYTLQGSVMRIQWSDGTNETYEYNVFQSTFDGRTNLGLRPPGAKKKIYLTLYQ
ncbi:MAG: lipocalin family protein [Bryobacteraceae bacterium]